MDTIDGMKITANDIYDDSTKEYLEYEFTLTTKDMQIIKQNSARSEFSYGEINFCTETNSNTGNEKSASADYCFSCYDGKECQSTFINAFADQSGVELSDTRSNKWKYWFYDPVTKTGSWEKGNMKELEHYQIIM